MATIKVTITRTKRKAEDQPFTVLIEEPRKQPYKMGGRYARKFTAKRGAIRHLKAILGFGGWFVYKTHHRLGVEFIYTTTKSK